MAASLGSETSITNNPCDPFQVAFNWLMASWIRALSSAVRVPSELSTYTPKMLVAPRPSDQPAVWALPVKAAADPAEPAVSFCPGGARSVIEQFGGTRDNP